MYVTDTAHVSCFTKKQKLDNVFHFIYQWHKYINQILTWQPLKKERSVSLTSVTTTNTGLKKIQYN